MRSPGIDQSIAEAAGSHAGVAGTYAFAVPETLPRVVSRLRRGDTQIPMVEVTLPEGITRKEMARVLDDAALPSFSAAAFLRSILRDLFLAVP